MRYSFALSPSAETRRFGRVIVSEIDTVKSLKESYLVLYIDSERSELRFLPVYFYIAAGCSWLRLDVEPSRQPFSFPRILRYYYGIPQYTQTAP